MSTAGQSGSLVTQLAQLESAFAGLRATFYVSAAIFVVWVWDIPLNLDDEVSVLWQRKGRVIKTLYALVRYTPFWMLGPNLWIYNPFRSVSLSSKLYVKSYSVFVTFLSHLDSCISSYITMTLTQGVCCMAVITVFALRVYALYSSFPRMRIALMIVITACQLAFLALGFVAIAIASRRIVWVESLNICFSGNPPMRMYSLLYGSMLIIEIMIVMATLYHAIRFRREYPSLKGTAPGIIIKTLHNDGFTYFLVIFTTRCILCPLIWGNVSPTVLLLTYVELVVMSTLTSRWILSFRQLAMSFWGDSIIMIAEATSDIPLTTIEVASMELEAIS
ncbi:hypothetical protein PIIN_09168 [Serendipita indica DSM 11827]|uniref:DUF6533 domain-containing protein n=1 Tax=Serendipita indica (strain DSM 11827) TaxID=1109443 RepID=G4TV41_SERID|nr:hypothetical protein PIIN_09168 [Serendipita indica DSM 11827]